MQEKEGERIDESNPIWKQKKGKGNHIAIPNDFWIGYTYLDRKFKVR